MKNKIKIFFPIVLLLTFVISLIMNIYTPKIADDYYWDNILKTGQKVGLIKNILPSIYDYYMANDESMA
jgi:hypothetical protein